MASVYIIIAAVAVLAYRTGGQESPFLNLIYVPLVLAGALSMRRALQAALASGLAYIAVTLARPAPRPWPGLLQVALFFAVAVLTADGMRRHEIRRRKQEAATREARQALDIQHLISSADDLAVTLDLVVLKQREIIAADSYAVLLTEGRFMAPCVVSGLPRDTLSLRFDAEQEEGGWRPADGYPLVIEDAHSTPTRFSEMDPAARSILAIPLHSVERLVGMLYFGSREPGRFRPELARRAEDFGNHVVFPIQRAQLEEDLRRLAFTDAQTSLYNHRHFQAQLEEELSRAQRYGRSVSLILFDIDDFKAFNDLRGHPAGDHLLLEVSHILRASLRGADIPARYGGEEFAIICPETQRDQAITLAERLCGTIAEAQFGNAEGERAHITVSVGVAAFPADAQTKSSLIDAADKALYQAKRAGKNRVVAYSDVSS